MSLVSTIEFSVPEEEYEKITKLIAYAKRIGITDYAQDSHDPEADEAARLNEGSP